MAIPEDCKEIPDEINFGQNLLLTPSLEEMGMPKAMANTVYARPLAPIGSWIERGEPLTEITFVHYRFDDNTGKTQKLIAGLFGASEQISYSVTIHSPISGFNLVRRNAPTRIIRSRRPTFNGIIGFEYALPVLLIPDDEPEWNAYDLQDKFSRLASYMKNYWEQGVHNLGQSGKYKRVSIAHALDKVKNGYNIGTLGSDRDVTPEEIEQARRWRIESGSVYNIKWPVCTYHDYCARKHSVGDEDFFYDLKGYITDYRSKDAKLRRKLKHLDNNLNNDSYEPQNFEYDIFISHASEDKDSIVRPLYNALHKNNISVWFDEVEIEWGDSLRGRIDDGLKKCKYGIVILSPNFFSKKKHWTKIELDALFAIETNSGKKAILPILHEMTYEDLVKISPTLAGKKGIKSTEGIPLIVNKVLKLCKKE